MPKKIKYEIDVILAAFDLERGTDCDLLKPIYSAFLYGKDWRFSVLHDKRYCISKTYDASEKDELLKIVAILKHLKHIILTELV